MGRETIFMRVDSHRVHSELMRASEDPDSDFLWSGPATMSIYLEMVGQPPTPRLATNIFVKGP